MPGMSIRKEAGGGRAGGAGAVAQKQSTRSPGRPWRPLLLSGPWGGEEEMDQSHHHHDNHRSPPALAQGGVLEGLARAPS